VVPAVLKLVETIHLIKENGDVLVFLTSPSEVEYACQQFSDMILDYKSFVVLPLHGKQQPPDQQKVVRFYAEKRKVIFCTNLAETSVTIKGVKFVIDTGLAKESRFDKLKNMNILEVC